jgi:hypothetical protein
MERMVSAILLSWKRTENLQPITRALLATKIVSEVIVWNNNPAVTVKGDSGANIKAINSSHNYLAYARFGAALLAQARYILFQDDDLLFRSADIVALHGELLADPARIYGFEGRNLQDGKYSRHPEFGETDIVLGQFMLFSKELLASVYGDFLRLTPFERGDDIAFSLLTGVRHVCRQVPRVELGTASQHALWRDTSHFAMRQEMVDRVLALRQKAQSAGQVGQ